MEEILIEKFNNPAVLETDELIKSYLDLKSKLKDYEIMLKTYETELKIRTNETNLSTTNYDLEYKRSKLLDKEKAKEYIYTHNLQDKFFKNDIDYKKIQNYLKAMENYEDFIKESNPRLIINRKHYKNKEE